MLPPPVLPQSNQMQLSSQVQKTQSNSLASTSDITAFYELIANGNFERLSMEQRSIYLNKICESMQLNPTTRPFAFIQLQGKLTVYALKEAANQLARRDNVSVSLSKFEYYKEQNILECVARAMTPDGRYTDEIAAISYSDALKGDNAANARMKLATKAKRRAILSHCGLGMLDESELDTIKDKRFIEDNYAQPQVLSSGKIETENKPNKTSIKDSRYISNTDDTVIDFIPDFIPDERTIDDGNTDQFIFNSDKRWLIDEINKVSPGLDRNNLAILGKSFSEYTSKAEVIAQLKRIHKDWSK